ncbi:hypothetical protein Q5752_000240 [Cryptotrichosporon argae]
MQLDVLLALLPLLGLATAIPTDRVRRVHKRSTCGAGGHSGGHNGTSGYNGTSEHNHSNDSAWLGAISSSVSASVSSSVVASLASISSAAVIAASSVSSTGSAAATSTSSAAVTSAVSGAAAATLTSSSIAAVELAAGENSSNGHSSTAVGTNVAAASSSVPSGASSQAASSNKPAVSTSASSKPTSSVGIASASTAKAASTTQVSSAAVPPTSTATSAAAGSTTALAGSTSAALSTQSSAQAATATATGTSSAVVGLGWASTSGTDMQAWLDAAGSRFAWYYNWDLTPSPDASSAVEFVPMVWGSGSVDSVMADEATWPSGTSYILSFNEPDQDTSVGGSDMSATDAATLHKQWVADLSGSYTIGSPAVAYGGESWLSEWVTACDGGCQYDFIPLHVYSTSASALTDYAQAMYTEFGKPLWFTEWACQDYSSGAICTADEVKTFMQDVISFFESTDYVERWAWFGAFETEASGSSTVSANPNGIENTDGSPNTLGEYYIALK